MFKLADEDQREIEAKRGWVKCVSQKNHDKSSKVTEVKVWLELDPENERIIWYDRSDDLDREILGQIRPYLGSTGALNRGAMSPRSPQVRRPSPAIHHILF